VAVIPVEFADQRATRASSSATGTGSLLEGRVHEKSPTGEARLRQRRGLLRRELLREVPARGKVFDWVRVGRPKAFYDGLPI